MIDYTFLWIIPIAFAIILAGGLILYEIEMPK